MWKPLLFIAALAIAGSAQAASPRDQLVVTPAWLAGHAADKDVVILHVGTQAGYNAGHIPGARLVDPKILQVSSPEGLSVEVPPPELLHQQMEALGISDSSHIVVYNETDEFQRATRVLFTLDVAGFGDHSSLLDGGLAEWKKTGHAKAFQTLVRGQRASDHTCLPCHTTGFGEVSGFPDVLENVQCESCHGARRGHPENGQKFPPVSETQCLTCHNPAKSPNFDYVSYLAKVRCPAK